MNRDSLFTISDVWLILHFIWLLPAKLAIAGLSSIRELATFLELTCATGESWGGAMFSFLVWGIVLLMISVTVDADSTTNRR